MSKKIIEDVPDERPEIPIPINDVTISNKTIYIKIKDPFNLKKYCSVLCDIEISVGLPANKRGIHMSRVVKSILDLAQNKYNNLSEFSSDLSQKIFETQRCNSVKIKLSGKYLWSVNAPQTDLRSSRPLNILSEIIFEGEKNMRKTIGIEVDIITACPCVQRFFSLIFNQDTSLQNENTSYDNMQNLGKLVTHCQKGKLMIKIENSKDDIRVKDLVEVAGNSVTLIYDLLKRPDERALVISALRKPQFVEDVVRKTVSEAYKNFKNSIDRIEVSVMNYESIHPHNVGAHIEMKMKDLEKYEGFNE